VPVDRADERLQLPRQWRPAADLPFDVAACRQSVPSHADFLHLAIGSQTALPPAPFNGIADETSGPDSR